MQLKRDFEYINSVYYMIDIFFKIVYCYYTK